MYLRGQHQGKIVCTYNNNRGIRDNEKGNNGDTKQLLAAVFTNRKDYRFLPFGDQISSTESMSIRKWVDNSGTADRVSFI